MSGNGLQCVRRFDGIELAAFHEEIEKVRMRFQPAMDGLSNETFQFQTF
jgi:hypothetical protein